MERAINTDVLASIDDWPVPTAAAAVVGTSGVLATHGELDHPFRLASVTKPLAASAILIAVEEQALCLDDLVDRVLPPDADPLRGVTLPGVTLRHLLAHASGLAMDRPQRMFEPATRRVYSNTGIELAAAMVESATDMPFAAYLDEAVCAPLKLATTTLTGSPAYAAISTVTDLARFGLELLAPSGLLSPPMRAQFSTVQFPGIRGVLPGYGGQNPNDWGLGVEIRSHKSPHWTGSRNSPATFGHFGQSGTMLWVDPEAELCLVALADRDFGDWAVHAWPTLSDAVLDAFGSAPSV